MASDLPPLHLTKVAFGLTSVEQLGERLAARAMGGQVELTTRYQPKRFAEIAGQGSLFWILKHQLIARSPILGFAEADARRCAILLDPELVRVVPHPKRAHQGWRYLEDSAAPTDLGEDTLGALPPELAQKLAELGL